MSDIKKNTFLFVCFEIYLYICIEIVSLGEIKY